VFAHAAFLTQFAHISGPAQTFSQRVIVTNHGDWWSSEEYECVPSSWACGEDELRWPFTVQFAPLPAEVGVVHAAFAYFHHFPDVAVNVTVAVQGPLQELCGEPDEEYHCEFGASPPDGGMLYRAFYLNGAGYLAEYPNTGGEVPILVESGLTSLEGFFSAYVEWQGYCRAMNAIGVCQTDFTFTPDFTVELWVEYTPAAIPEPGTAALTAICLLALAARIRKR
jgi:hypothetical protein